MNYIASVISAKFQQALRSLPALLLTGPRQSGKTTFLKQEIVPRGFESI